MRSLISFLRRRLSFASGTDSEIDQAQNPRPSLEASRDRPPVRVFPSSGFDVLESSLKLEEETYPWYSVKDFYPAAIGEVFQNTYQVVAKLGYGTASTTWLCRDLRRHRYVTLKIYASGGRQTAREVSALKHINSVIATSQHVKHIGTASIRTLLDQFQISRPKSSRTNFCLAFDPLGVSLADARELVYGGRMPLNLVKSVAFYMLQALDFLHRQANLVHGDIQEDNIMFAVEETSEWRAVEEVEMAEPSPRKAYKNHVIHSSRVLELPTPTIPVLCDFGEARFGSEAYREHAMPDLYRAPEILLRIEWNEKIDIWALGLMLWTLVEGTNLFTNNEGGRWKSALPHMARMISLLGPPPQYLLDMTPVTKDFFDKTGNYKIVETSLEAEATALEGEAKADFLRFLRRMLHWDQDNRPSAQELLKDPWLVVTDNSESEDGEHGE
ncbi:Serine/threonine-protein kinase SRPK [Madurella mycetomatis]|uniref:non-specific serine/threonine protein kinase n=1 Tax=Madurella mycetomatis TaxID=100816 RepID=A0A175WA55_9PEZI|nr:Serine/threonine-protein kinase SRPK [Madurella mycetomatis]